MPDPFIDKLIVAWQSRDIGQIEAAVKVVVKEGYSGAQLMTQVGNYGIPRVLTC